MNASEEEKPIRRTRSRARGRTPTTCQRRPGMPPSLTSVDGVEKPSVTRFEEENQYMGLRRASSSTSSPMDTSSGLGNLFTRGSGRFPSSSDTDKLGSSLSNQNIDSQEVVVSTRRPRGGSQTERSKSRKAQRGRDCEPILFTRPREINSKKGKTGQTIRLYANYFTLPKVPDWCLFQYRVDFDPPGDRRAVKNQMLAQHKQVLVGYIFDGTVLVTPYQYGSEPMKLYSTQESDGAVICITVRLVSSLEFGDYHYIHFYNILMRRCLQTLKLELVGRHYYDPQARQKIDQYRLELWPGYITSIRQHEQELLLCTEITHKVMRQDTVLDLLIDCAKQDHGDYKNLFSKTIVGSIVLTDYNNRTYRVHDVDFCTTPASTFDRNGKPTTYEAYYYERYEVKIQNSNQPMLVTKPKQRDRNRGQDENVYLVPELCRMTGLPDNMRTNFEAMKKLSECTRLDPSQRMERLQHFNRRLHTNDLIMEELESWQMSLNQDILSIPARILPRERIILGTHEGDTLPVRCDPGPRNDWTSELKTKPMLCSEPVDSWVVILPTSLKYEVQQFVSQLRKSAAQMEWRMCEPTYRELTEDKTQSYIEALGNAIACYNPKFILIVLPTNRLDRYSAVKTKCCVECAVPTQVILKKNISSKNIPSIATKVAIQLNCKIGGAPWTVEIPMQDLMVVGFDVYDDSMHRGQSVGALVASLNRPMSRYFSAVSYHKTGEELSNELSAHICKALHKYKEYNNVLPKRIVIYRNGVGEGQIQYVHRHEVTLLEETLKKVYGSDQVKMAFIVVTKRINTRLFFDGVNPQPGTIVDDVITLPERYDFFLVSQSVRQGTVSPTSYNVIHDKLGLEPDKLQRLTYKLTHLYFNWSYSPSAVIVKRYKGYCRHGNACRPKPGETTMKQVKVRRPEEGKSTCGIVEVEEHNSCTCDCSTEDNKCNEMQKFEDCECRCLNGDEIPECEKSDNHHWNPETCKCQCKEDNVCGSMHTWDPKECKCILKEDNEA